MDLAGVLAGLQHLEGPTTWTDVAVIVGTLVALGVALVGVVRSLRRPKESPSPAPVPKRDLLPATVTPQFLIALREGRMSAHADRDLAPYIGKWMRISRNVDDLDGRPGEYRLISFYDTDGKPARPAVFFRFGKRWDEKLQVLPKGTAVTVEGKLVSTGSNYVSLEECELVEDGT